ncbi:MAG: anti-sigma F factor antagonist [Clostridia bacterium]|nr:anti-sigma F factor antagonist [Clostridia bacterium]
MRVEKAKGTVTVYLEGELDHFSAQQIRRIMDHAIEESSIKSMILDMENMTFMDSSGIGVILGRYKQLRQRGGKMMVRKMNRQVEKVFRLSGMDQLIDII